MEEADEEEASTSDASRTAGLEPDDDLDLGGPVTLGDEPPVVDDDPYFEDAPLDEPDDGGIVMLDEPDSAPRTRSASATRSSTSRSRSGGGGGWDDTPTTVQLMVRGGYNPYYNLGFITTGGEVHVDVGTGVHVVAGLEVWSVQRDIPERFQAQAGGPSEWNAIFPVNVGVVYKADLSDGRIRPYAGADLISAQYLVPEGGGSLGRWSFGARARGGLDLMLVRNFGLNVNVAMGFWTASDWEAIDVGVGNTGLLPQVSAGTVLAF